MFEKNFDVAENAYTVCASAVCETPETAVGVPSRSHATGWTISGAVQDQGLLWVNEFSAVHPRYGRVWGDFETTVFADSEEGFDDFFEKHPPNFWDYHDI